MELQSIYWVMYLVPASVGLLLHFVEMATKFCENFVENERWPIFVVKQVGDPNRPFVLYVGLILLVPMLGAVVSFLLLRGAIYFSSIRAINWLARRLGFPVLKNY